VKVGDLVKHTGNRTIHDISKTVIEIQGRVYIPSLFFDYPNSGVIVEVRERLIRVYWNDSIGIISHPRTSLEVISESR